MWLEVPLLSKLQFTLEWQELISSIKLSEITHWKVEPGQQSAKTGPLWKETRVHSLGQHTLDFGVGEGTGMRGHCYLGELLHTITACLPSGVTNSWLSSAFPSSPPGRGDSFA